MTYKIPAQVDGAGSIAGPGSLLITSSALVSDANPIITIFDTEYTVLPENNNATFYCVNDSAVTITVPLGLGEGFSFGIYQGGAGAVTPTADGPSIVNHYSYTATAGQYAFISLDAVAADLFILTGDGA